VAHSNNEVVEAQNVEKKMKTNEEESNRAIMGMDKKTK